jgi:hypothetical protein
MPFANVLQDLALPIMALLREECVYLRMIAAQSLLSA